MKSLGWRYLLGVDLEGDIVDGEREVERYGKLGADLGAGLCLKEMKRLIVRAVTDLERTFEGLEGGSYMVHHLHSAKREREKERERLVRTRTEAEKKENKKLHS